MAVLHLGQVSKDSSDLGQQWRWEGCSMLRAQLNQRPRDQTSWGEREGVGSLAKGRRCGGMSERSSRGPRSQLGHVGSCWGLGSCGRCESREDGKEGISALDVQSWGKGRWPRTYPCRPEVSSSSPSNSIPLSHLCCAGGRRMLWIPKGPHSDLLKASWVVGQQERP